MASSRSLLRPAVLLALVLVGFPCLASLEPRDEAFQYRWRLTNFLGRVAGLFFPSRGDGLLTYRTDGAGHLVSQLEITSEKSEEGEFWLYGAEIDIRKGRTVRAWSSYRYRGKDKSRRAEVDERGVVDIASGILKIRQAPPEAVTPMRIWSDGKVYPVEVVPKGPTILRLGDRKVETRRFLVRGSGVAGPSWKGRIELWLQEDEAATPAAILIYRSGIGVLLELNLR